MKRKLIDRIPGPLLVLLMVGISSPVALAAYCPDGDLFYRNTGKLQAEQVRPNNTTESPSEDTDARSTTGPEPPPGLVKGKSSPELDYQVVIPDVPAYLWYRGCGPTAAGMVIGYWDSNGFDDLVTGGASTQTADVNNMISSPGNYSDYCLPVDSYPNLLPDKSEPPFGDEHPDDCLADFMKTSQSYYSNYFGWSWYSHMDDSFRGYIQEATPHYEATVYNSTWGQFTWDSFRDEINANNPVVLLVDTDANDVTDHFVTAIGYGETDGTPMYVCRNTWDADYSNDWFEFAQISYGQPWGIYGATILHLVKDTFYLTVSSTDGGTVVTPGEGTFAYNAGDTVELLAVPETGWSFSHWSGDAAGLSPGITITMDRDKDITANFTLQGITLIGAINQDPAVFEGQQVTVTGQYRGWEAGHGPAPVTRSDWVIQDDSGSIYVTGMLPGLTLPGDIGKTVEVEGIVRTNDGQPYIEAAKIVAQTIKNNLTVSPGRSEQTFQIAEEKITDFPPIEFPEKRPAKLDSQLHQLVLAAARGEAASYARQRNIRMVGEGVRVIIECQPGQVYAARKTAIDLGAAFETSYRDSLQVVIPISSLTALADNPDIRFVRLPWLALPATITSEGVGLINADDWYTAGFSGAGVKVAIVDGGFSGYTTQQSQGELPANLTTWWAPSIGGPGSLPHGTACAEIVYDIAPGAQFYLANFSTDIELGNAVNYLIAQGVDIISFSMGFPNAGLGDGTGPICEIVDSAHAAGILWSSAIGNSAQRHWQGDFVDTAPDDGIHEFSQVPFDEDNTISVQAGQMITVLLRWDDPWGGSSNDYDLLLGDKYGNFVCWSTYTQDGLGGNDYPMEAFQYVATYTGFYYILIVTLGSPQVRNFHLYTFAHDLQYQTASSSFAIPSDSPNAMAVGAVYWGSPSTLEPFSSQGPTDDNRKKPDIVAPDGVTTATYNPFYGTSASTPCTAGAAALVREAYPSYTPDQVQSFLEGHAIDLYTEGKDNLSGSGRLHLGAPPTCTLNMHISPPGAGTTTPGEGIHTYDTSTMVNISAAPNPGYRFSHWSGDAAGTSPSTSITMDSDKDVTANFVRQYTLNIDIIPADSGTTNPGEGAHTYDAGIVVNISATPNPGYRFSHWSGDAAGTNPATSITMGSDKDVTANFVHQYNLTIGVSPPGAGTTTPEAGTHNYDEGSLVDLSAVPNPGYRFSHWSGDASGTDPSTSITIDSDKDVTANFIHQYTLTINVSPPGAGTTTPEAGTHNYDEGSPVDLSAVPNQGYSFSHWSGDAAGTSPSTSITMDSDKDVTANFVPLYALTINVSPVDSGTTIPGAGSHTYDAGTVIDLSAIPGVGWGFSHWSGDAAGTDLSTSITMDSDKDVTANFVVAYTLTIDISPPESGTTTPPAGSHVYNTGTVVDLSATPGHGWAFSQWSGDTAGTNPTTSILIDSNKDVTASFNLELDTLEVETATGEGKEIDGISVITVSIASVKDPVSGETVPGVTISGYSASLTFNPDFMEVLEIRGGDHPFDTIPPENIIIYNIAGTASISNDVRPSGTLPSIIVFRIVARLNDNCLVSDYLAVNIAEASNPDGTVMNALDQPMSITLQRGDVQKPANGNVNIIDAMYGAQYIVGIRVTNQVNLLNLSSVHHNEPKDKANITDCLYIAQYVVGMRNEYFELAGQ